jgi:phosphoglycerol transferase MdoB-like AlkP superfamily enzyme
MFLKNKTTKFIFTMLFLNIVYFFIYYKFLAVELSVLSFLFTVILSLSFISFLIVLNNRKLVIFAFIFYILYIVYTLANFAYYTVFAKFFTLDILFASESNIPTSMLLDFYILIPYQIYLSAVILVFISFIVLLKFFSPKNRQLIFCNQVISKGFQTGILITSGILFISINIFGIGLVNFYKENPKEDWWSTKKYISDHGIGGFVYNQINAAVMKNFETAHAKVDNIEIVPEDEVLGEKIEDKLTKFDELRDLLNNLSVSEKQENKNINIPKFEKHPNILIYQIESVGSWGMKGDPGSMPYLEKKMKDNISVSKFFANSCQTINAEFASMCSFVPFSQKPIPDTSSDSDFNCLPKMLGDDFGYKTAFFHANVSDFWNRKVLIPKWGFQDSHFVPYYSHIRLDDGKVLLDAIDYMKNSEKPTFAYVAGFTSHSAHTFEEIAWTNKTNGINITLYDGEVDMNVVNNVFLATETDVRAYMGFLEEIDRDIEILFDELENNNLLDKTIVIIYGDHRYYDFPKETVENFYYHNEIPFMMYIPGMGAIQPQKIASHMDMAPTILNILMGDEYESPDHFLGTSLFSNIHPNSIVQKCLGGIDYVDEKTIIKGNVNSNIYNIFDTSREFVSDEEKQGYLANLSSFVDKTDEILIHNQLVK